MSPELKLLLAVGAALFLLARNLPPALQALFPNLRRVRETEDDGSLAPEREPAAARVDEGLRGLGFQKVGAFEVRPPLSSGHAALVYAAPELHAFADLEVEGGALQVTLFTPFEGGQAVLTSDHPRSGRNDPDLLIGGLPAHDLAGLWAAHRRRVAQLAEGPLRAVPWSDLTLAGRVAAEQRFYEGAGKRLLRARGLLPALMLVTSVLFAMLAVLQFLGLHRA